MSDDNEIIFTVPTIALPILMALMFVAGYLAGKFL